MDENRLGLLEKAIRAVCEFKQRAPYYYLEWSTKKGSSESNAAVCGRLLDRVAECLEWLLKDAGIPAGKIRKCSGASYYPREPWIGIFYKGEKANDGVYPIIFFSEDGRFVYAGCTASLEFHQPHFAEEYCGEDISSENHDGLMAKGSIHVSVEELSDGMQAIVDAVINAYYVWKSYRERYPRLEVNSVKIARQEIGVTLEQGFREIIRRRISHQDFNEDLGSDAYRLLAWWQESGRTAVLKDAKKILLEEGSNSPDSLVLMSDKIAAEEISRWCKGKAARDRWQQTKKERTSEEAWYVREEVKDLHDWLRRLDLLKKEFPDRLWVFRGQADAAWKLETGLGLKVFSDGNPMVDIEAVVAYEHEAMDAFRREISKTPEYCHFDGVDLLSLMQHYGSKTRLLDFSLSPLVALYMALDQRDNYVSQVSLYNDYHGDADSEFDSETVVWMVEAKQFAYSGFVRDLQVGFPVGESIVGDSIKWLKSNATNGTLPWWAAKEMFHQDATRILKAERPLPYHPGIDVIFPRKNSARISSQEGLFLMPRRMDCSFHRNLEMATERAKKFGGGFIVPKKYVFSRKVRGRLREHLQSLCITSKMIYPDLTGLAQSLNLKVNFKKN